MHHFLCFMLNISVEVVPKLLLLWHFRLLFLASFGLAAEVGFTVVYKLVSIYIVLQCLIQLWGLLGLNVNSITLLVRSCGPLSRLHH